MFSEESYVELAIRIAPSSLLFTSLLLHYVVKPGNYHVPACSNDSGAVLANKLDIILYVCSYCCRFFVFSVVR